MMRFQERTVDIPEQTIGVQLPLPQLEESYRPVPGIHSSGVNTFVTEPALPPLEEFYHYLEQIWASKQVTNNGQFHQELERALAEYLGVPYVSLFSNGTLALMVALQALNISGEVITTPYSFVATTHAISWNGMQPVFCDIDPLTLNLDPIQIEAAITPRTTAIMPVHIYGTPCDLVGIQTLADNYGLKVIYDAAHAFGVERKDESILNAGDLSVLSFHGTKIYTTFEGGAVICQDAAMKRRIDYLKNFGFADEVTVIGPGINGKMNEFSAALGLLQLEHIDTYIEKRRGICERYRSGLQGIPGIRLLPEFEDIRYNYAYFPIFIDEMELGRTRDTVYRELEEAGYRGRRYFYPLISHFPPYRGLPSAKSDHLPVAEEVTRQVICLPLHPELESSMVNRIIDICIGGGL